MNFPGIVSPYNEDLLRGLSGHSVAVRVQDPADAAAAAACARQSGSRLVCVLIESDSPLSEIELPEDSRGIPLALAVPSAGRFRSFAGRLKHLRQFNLRVYLSCSRPENILSLRILSSVGIHGCAVIERGVKHWEEIADLMTYAMLERAHHASIEPFTFIADNYDPFSHIDWAFFYFDDPKSFLHLDIEGRVALSREDLAKERFVARNLCEIADPDQFPPIQEWLRRRREYFVGLHPCASCAGWKLCLGKYETSRGPECSAFFIEMIEVARRFKALRARNGEAQIWQP